jgi:hypothetical protein
METKLEVFEVKVGDKTFYNVSPKKANIENGTNPMPMDSYVIIEKKYPNGLEKSKSFKQTGGKDRESKFYVMRVGYDGKEVGFILNEQEHKSYLNAGEVGDKIKMTHVRRSYDQKQSDGTTKQKFYTELEFSVVN